jgi:hypothetical protein
MSSPQSEISRVVPNVGIAFVVCFASNLAFGHPGISPTYHSIGVRASTNIYLDGYADLGRWWTVFTVDNAEQVKLREAEMSSPKRDCS